MKSTGILFKLLSILTIAISELTIHKVEASISLRVKPLGPDWDDQSHLMMSFRLREFNFVFDSWTISGMSNGGTFSSNLMVIFHKYLDGVAIWSGESVTYKNDTQANFLNGKPVYIYHGI